MSGAGTKEMTARRKDGPDETELEKRPKGEPE
jgi:hypothetical protein